MGDVELERRVAALGGFAEHTRRHVEDLKGQVEALEGQVEALHGIIAELVSERKTAPPAVRSWLLGTDPDQARADLADLLEWLSRVFVHYPRGALPSCWAWHPAVVEELWWLRQVHWEAYEGPNASYTRAADWHDRQRPQAVERITRALGACELSLHTPPPDPPGVPLRGAAERIAAAWTATRSLPHPTGDELAEADAHDRAQHRSNRR